MSVPDVPSFDNAFIGKYHFLKPLGRGGYAIVWLADECSPTREVIRPVAIKIFIDDLVDRDSFQRTFENFRIDLKFLADLAPDNPIIEYYTSEMEDIFVGSSGVAETMGSRGPSEAPSGRALTAFFIVMEYADGGSLGSPEYRNDVILGQDQSYIRHFLDICTGLRAAHSRLVIHRDIKPSNLLWFKKRNRVKIGDFGIARHLNELRMGSGSYIVGTTQYMSPESFDPGTIPAPARDIYALGCTFYELLAGEPAFSLPPSMADASIRASCDAYERLHEHAPRPDALMKAPSDVLSVELSNVFRRMMSVDPADRPQLNEVIAALERSLPRPAPPRPALVDVTDGVEVPREPTFLSLYTISPAFRREHLRETYFLVFIQMTVETWFKYRLLFTLLRSYFEMSASVCELYGRYDFLIRVWSTRRKITDFCRRVIDEVLDDDVRSLHVMACDEVQSLGNGKRRRSRRLSDDLVPKVLARLHEAQSDPLSERGKEAAEWLRDQQVYLQKRPPSLGRDRLHCFCLVSQPAETSQAERDAKWLVLLNSLEQSPIPTGRWNISVCRKAYAPIEGLENERSDYVVGYMPPNFDAVVQVPALILDQSAEHRFRVSTFLASKRYYIDSDLVLLR